MFVYFAGIYQEHESITEGGHVLWNNILPSWAQEAMGQWWDAFYFMQKLLKSFMVNIFSVSESKISFKGLKYN